MICTAFETMVVDCCSHHLQSTVTTPGALVHLQGSGHPTESGHVREAIGKSLRRTFEEGELKKEEERGVSFKLGSPSWQAIVVGST